MQPTNSLQDEFTFTHLITTHFNEPISSCEPIETTCILKITQRTEKEYHFSLNHQNTAILNDEFISIEKIESSLLGASVYTHLFKALNHQQHEKQLQLHFNQQTNELMILSFTDGNNERNALHYCTAQATKMLLPWKSAVIERTIHRIIHIWQQQEGRIKTLPTYYINHYVKANSYEQQKLLYLTVIQKINQYIHQYNTHALEAVFFYSGIDKNQSEEIIKVQTYKEHPSYLKNVLKFHFQDTAFERKKEANTIETKRLKTTIINGYTSSNNGYNVFGEKDDRRFEIDLKETNGKQEYEVSIIQIQNNTPTILVENERFIFRAKKAFDATQNDSIPSKTYNYYKCVPNNSDTCIQAIYLDNHPHCTNETKELIIIKKEDETKAIHFFPKLHYYALRNESPNIAILPEIIETLIQINQRTIDAKKPIEIQELIKQVNPYLNQFPCAIDEMKSILTIANTEAQRYGITTYNQSLVQLIDNTILINTTQDKLKQYHQLIASIKS